MSRSADEVSGRGWAHLTVGGSTLGFGAAIVFTVHYVPDLLRSRQVRAVDRHYGRWVVPTGASGRETE